MPAWFRFAQIDLNPVSFGARGCFARLAATATYGEVSRLERIVSRRGGEAIRMGTNNVLLDMRQKAGGSGYTHQ